MPRFLVHRRLVLAGMMGLACTPARAQQMDIARATLLWTRPGRIW